MYLQYQSTEDAIGIHEEWFEPILCVRTPWIIKKGRQIWKMAWSAKAAQLTCYAKYEHISLGGNPPDKNLMLPMDVLVHVSPLGTLSGLCRAAFIIGNLLSL